MKPRSIAISCEGYIGLPGAGKTYALAFRGLEAMRLGRTVYSNFGLRGTIPLDAWDHANIGNTKDPGPACDCGKCFVSISHAVILIDEINLWAPSRMWNALPIGLLHRWAQVRKFETQIIWSAQHEARVDKVIRELTGWMWESKTYFMGRRFKYEAFEPNDLRKQNAKALGSHRLRLKRGIAEAYDTLELINVGTHLADASVPILAGPNEPDPPPVFLDPGSDHEYKPLEVMEGDPWATSDK